MNRTRNLERSTPNAEGEWGWTFDVRRSTFGIPGVHGSQAREPLRPVLFPSGGRSNDDRRPVDARRGDGFTLIELMVVIGIIAMVMGMGMPSILQTLKKEPLRQGVSDMVEGLSAARAQAILDGVPAEFVLRSTDRAMFVTRARDPRATNNVTGEPLGLEPSPTPAVSPGVRPFFAQLKPEVVPSLVEVNLRSQMDAEEARVRFYPNGTSDEFTVLLESRAGARKVSLDSITALADVEVIR